MTSKAQNFPLRRRKIIPELLKDRGDMLVVAGLGSTAWDITAAGDHDLSFPLWGAMGGGRFDWDRFSNRTTQAPCFGYYW